jgi:alanyl-tRNA synthetase
VLADHIRACSFLIADGVIPGNEGRGYVLRRIIRRAIRHGYKLGARAASSTSWCPTWSPRWARPIPSSARRAARVMDVLRRRRSASSHHRATAWPSSKASWPRWRSVKKLDGETAFKLHDTFGFPLDLTADICRERGVTVDEAGFDAAMARQREQARAAGKFKMAAGLEYDGARPPSTATTPGRRRATSRAVQGRRPVNELQEGDDGVVVLDHTPFYAESGGQVGDRGELRNAGAPASSRRGHAEDPGRPCSATTAW